MMKPWSLPTSLNVSGADYRIRTDFRDVLNILIAFNDPELDGVEKNLTMLDILYEELEIVETDAGFYVRNQGEVLTPEKVGECIQRAMEFIDAGMEADDRPKPKMIDWEQDAAIIVPAVNKVLGEEIRSRQYLHWWTFMGAYTEIGESLFSQVISIRQKKQKGKRLEKWEREFYNNNRKTCDLRKRHTKKEQEEIDSLNAMLG